MQEVNDQTKIKQVFIQYQKLVSTNFKLISVVIISNCNDIMLT